MRMNTRNFLFALMLLMFGCGGPHSGTEDVAGVESAEAVAEEISIERYRADLETLSSDAFGGRAPSSEGEQKTVDYLIQSFEQAGLVGGNNGSFIQEVPLVASTATSISPLTVTLDSGDSWQLQQGPSVVSWTKRLVDNVDIEGSELVFVGYGIVAPEYGWNDYAGVDAAGKTVVMMVNDPGFATGDPDLFEGRRMTYYGRWTYKYEEAARQGATGVILIHQVEAAGYPWTVVAGGWVGEQFDLQRENGNVDRAAFESWITFTDARQLFERAGLDLTDALDQAAKRGFEAMPIPATVSLSIENSFKRSVSQNVVALRPGTEAADEYVAFSAHWDHLGQRDVAEGEDGIYNGAVDNASGTAALLELARSLSGQSHRRSLLFVVVTAEESGLLGSAWFAANPTVPLEKTAGLINIDAMNIVGPTNDVTVIGYGSSTMEDFLSVAAEAQGRRLEDEPTPEKGFFFRSDHFNFAKFGVPVLYAKGGIDHVTEGSDYGRQRQAEHIATRYHQPSDEIHDGWDFDGLAQDLELYHAVASALANSSQWPEWSEKSAFRQIRESSADQRR